VRLLRQQAYGQVAHPHKIAEALLLCEAPAVADLLSTEETARRLRTTQDNVRTLARRGFLRARYPIGLSVTEDAAFDPEEVAAFAELRMKNLGLAEVGALAKMASVRTAGLSRQMERLMEFLGVDVPVLDLTEPAVLQLYAELESILALESIPVTPIFVHVWAKKFYAMGEEVFERIGECTGDDEPWKKPLDLATRLFREKPVGDDLELETAYRYLLVGRRFMRQAAYFYVRQQHGTRTAHRLFQEVEGDLNYRILSVVMPDT
jgi:hypothetical protein